MATPVEQLSFKPTGATTARSLGAWTGDVVNVKNFGATGNGSTDDYAAIQAALDYAFGTSASPHGNGGGPSNKPVYFPAGTYKILTPIRVTAVWGGRIYGDGPLSSIITHQGAATAVNAEGICPTLWLNGCNFTLIEGLSFVNVADPTNHITACMWWGPDGANGGTSAHGNVIISCTTSAATYGVFHGSSTSQANSENTYIGCTLSSHEYGAFVTGANTLNIRMYGCGISLCSVAGIKTNNFAMMSLVSNVAFDQNFVDCDFASAGISVLSGVRTESASFVKTNSVTDMVNCVQASQGGTLTASTSGTTLTVTATSAFIAKGMVIYGGALAAKTRVLAQLTGSAGGTGTYTLSASSTIASTTFTVRPVFCDLSGACVVSMNGCVSAFDPALISSSNSVLSIRSNNFLTRTDLFKYFDGQLLQYDIAIAAPNNFIVANLPTASAIFKGVRMFVTDSTVVGSGNFGATVAGTGSDTVPVYCDGTNWKIG